MNEINDNPKNLRDKYIDAVRHDFAQSAKPYGKSASLRMKGPQFEDSPNTSVLSEQALRIARDSYRILEPLTFSIDGELVNPLDLYGVTGKTPDISPLRAMLFATMPEFKRHEGMHHSLTEALGDSYDWEPRTVRDLAHTALLPLDIEVQDRAVEAQRELKLGRIGLGL
jgi:hypothetical protein